MVPGTLSSRVGGGGIDSLATRATGKRWLRSLIDLFYRCMRSFSTPPGLVLRDSRSPRRGG